MVGGAQVMLAAGLRPRLTKEKGFSSNPLLDLINTSSLIK
jgi:hypothetical protein